MPLQNPVDVELSFRTSWPFCSLETVKLSIWGFESALALERRIEELVSANKFIGIRVFCAAEQVQAFQSLMPNMPWVIMPTGNFGPTVFRGDFALHFASNIAQLYHALEDF